MGGIKSKVFGETEFKEDKFKNEILKDKQIDRLEAEELQEEKTSNTIEELSINYKEPQNFQFTSSLSTLSTGSFQDLNENCLTVRNDNVHLETLKNSELNNNNNNSKSSSHHFPLLDLSLLETKHQQKIRPYTLFNQNRINNTKNNIQNKENNNNNNNKMETIPTVTSFQPPNHLQKNQYFRSFRMASRRIFNPNVNNDNKNKQPTSNDSESDTTDVEHLMNKTFDLNETIEPEDNNNNNNNRNLLKTNSQVDLDMQNKSTSKLVATNQKSTDKNRIPTKIGNTTTATTSSSLPSASKRIGLINSTIKSAKKTTNTSTTNSITTTTTTNTINNATNKNIENLKKIDQIKQQRKPIQQVKSTKKITEPVQTPSITPTTTTTTTTTKGN